MLLLFSNFVRKFVTLGLLTQLTNVQGSRTIQARKFDDFKGLMMYFNEPLLTSASLRDFRIAGDDGNCSFEGAFSILMAKKLSEVIEAVDDDEKLNLFGENLKNGIELMETLEFEKSRLNIPMPINHLTGFFRNLSSGRNHNIEGEARDLQAELLEKLNASRSKNKTIVIPFILNGIVLIIEEVENTGKYNLIVVNTGDGIEYHYATKDPNNIYSSLPHSWIRFEGIPEEEIFSKNFWFMYAFISLLKPELVGTIESQAGSVKHYFYGSILSNFSKYMELDKNEKRLLPGKCSGHCSLSSLMAAQLYSSENLQEFHYNRVIIGQTMLKQFFEKYENDSEFKALISDGFDLISRKLFLSTASAVGQQVLLYLEARYPESFTHAGLIGSGRSDWIKEKKLAAIKAIEGNRKDYELLKISVELGLKIQNFVKETEIDSESVRISISQKIRSLPPSKYSADSLPIWKVIASNKASLNEPIPRQKRKNSDFKSIKEGLKHCEKNNTNILTCVRDIFEQCDKDDWWTYLDSGTHSEHHEFLIICRKILHLYMSISTVPNSFDDLVSLAHLQIGVWKSAVEMDKKVEEKFKLDLKNYKPPLILEEIIKQIKQTTLTSSKYLNWPIKTNFNPKNLDKLHFLLKNYKTLSVGAVEFLGPSKLLNHSKMEISTKDVFNEMKNTEQFKPYEIMLSHEKISKDIDSIRNKKYEETDDFKWTKENYVKLTIFLSRFDLVESQFPQFSIMMDSLMIIYKRAAKLPINIWGSHAFSSNLEVHSEVPLNFKVNSEGYRKNFDFNQSGNQFIENCFIIKSSINPDIFYKLRHSQAQVDSVNITSFEAWLNYVKGSIDATIFDNAYFLYLSDHLLNFPKLLLNPKNDEIEIESKNLYPSGFEIRHIKDIYQGLMKIIKSDLNDLILKGKQSNEGEARKIINRTVNIAIPLVKFISRIDNENLISAESASKMLSLIYRQFWTFTSLKNNYGANEEQISQVNILMGYICDLPIRNPRMFLQLIADVFPKRHLFTSRITLSRAHWFVAKIYYLATSIGKSHSDDLFSHGQIYHPITGNEKLDMGIILKYIFASKYYQDLDIVTINYDKNGDIVLLSDNVIKLGIQLSSGKVIKNGNELVKKNVIINHPTFKEYFAEENDRIFASQGEITKIGSIIVYIVQDFKFKGNTITIIYGEADSMTRSRLAVYRKYKESYYIWKQDVSKYLKATNYRWIYGYRLYENDQQAIMIKDDDSEPLNIIDFDVEIKISDFSKNDQFRLLDYQNPEDLNRHLRYFTDTDTLLARIDRRGNRLVIIYPGLRFYENPNYPIVLVESDQRSPEFDVKNVPGLIIESEQVALHGIGIAGTLVARNKDGQRFILTPLSSEGSEDVRNLGFVERIPIVDDLPAPQTRLQRLLLSFYCIKAREYSYARELLHPFTSINQNEPLSTIELTVINWIVNIKNGGPESEALKLMAYMHCYNNSRKFPLEYRKPAGNDVSEDGKIKTERFKTKEEITMKLSEILRIYFSSIRSLPEKFYLHRIFPEFLTSQIASNIKSLFPSTLQGPPKETKQNFDIRISKNVYFENCCDRLNFKLERFNELDITNILGCYLEDKKYLQKYLNFMSKLIHKAVETIENGLNSTFSDNEAVIICAAKNLDSFEKAAQLAKAHYEKPEEVKDVAVIGAIKEALNICKKQGVFGHLNASLGSVYTDAQDIINTLKADMKKKVKGYEKLPDHFDFKPVNEEDLKRFKDFISLINSVLNPDKSLVDAGFTKNNIGKSPVLEKLIGSIDNFVKEKGQFNQTELEISETQEISLFQKFVEDRIQQLEAQSAEMKTNLSTMIKTDSSNATHSHVIENINRLMHNRKAKTFESIYPCYQRLSVSCIQNKFPQLEWTVCEELLSESMKYYSTQVLLEFMNKILDFVGKFMELSGSNKSIAVDDLTLFLDEAGKIFDFNTRLRSPSILNFEYRSKRYRLRSEQVNDIDDLTSIDPKTGLFKSAVIQRMMAAGKTLVLGTISVVKKALDGNKLSILVPPASLYQSNLSAMQARTYSFFKTKGHNFIFPRFEFGGDGDISEVVIPFLKFILQNIENIKKSSDYYVLSPDTLQSFLNSYIEMINYHTAKLKDTGSTDFNIIEALKLYAKIYNIFRMQGSIILDEIDMTMDPKKELNFPTVENEPFNMFAATLITDLIEFSTFDKEVTSLGLDILGNNQSGLTSENFEKYRQLLFQYISKQFDDKNSLWSEILLSSTVKELNKEQIMEFLKEEDIEFMRDWMVEIHKAGKELIGNALIIVKVQLWRYLKDAMKATANLNFGTTGPNRPDVEYAIPYLAANTPSPSSEFSDRWETLNKTLLMLAAVSCPERIAKNMIGYVRKRIVQETNLKVKTRETVTYQNITTLIPGVDPLTLDDKNLLDVNLIHEALKTRSPVALRLLFSYALDEIFSTMKFPVEQVTSNALNMTSMFGSVQGYSGTIDNVNILPREVVDGAYDNHMINEKNNGGIALKLIKDSRDPNLEGQNKHVYQIPDEVLKKSVRDIVETMIKSSLPIESERNDLSAIIDTGAFFKNYKNKDVAEAILNALNPRITVVLYYDEDSNQVEYMKRIDENTFEIGFISSTDPDIIFKTTQTDISKRFTFYDQRHITGSDILQPKTARALMTIGTRVLLRDILQGTLRMRQFMTSQKVHLITSNSAANFYFSKSGEIKDHVEVSDMISLGAFNEDDKQLIENEKLAFAKIDNEVRRFVLEEITRAILESEKANYIIPEWFTLNRDGAKNIRDLFIRLIRENPLAWMVKSVKKDKGQVLAHYVEFWITKIEKTAQTVAKLDPQFDLSAETSKSAVKFKALKEVLKTMSTIEKDDEKDPEKLKKQKNLLPGALNKEISDRVSDFDAGGEVEMQILTQQLAELELDKTKMIVNSKIKLSTRESFSIVPMTTNLTEEAFGMSKDVLNLHEILYQNSYQISEQKMAISALLTTGKRLAVSKDLIQFMNIKPEKPYYIFKEYTWEGSHILIQVLPKKKGIRAVLLSTESASEAIKEILSNNTDFKGSTFWLCDLSGSISATNDTKTTTKTSMNILDFMPSSKLLFFDLLIFNGSLNNILTSKILKEIYSTKWLKSENRQFAAQFLLKRMDVLAEKSKYIVDETNDDMKFLNRVARGDKENSNEINTSSGLFKKPPISESIEAAYHLTERPTFKHSSSKTVVNVFDVYRTVVNATLPQKEMETDIIITPLEEDGSETIEHVDCAVNLVTDVIDLFDETANSSSNVKNWLDVVDDATDLNNYIVDVKPVKQQPIDEDDSDSDDEEEDSDSDDEEDAPKSSNQTIIIVIFVVIAGITVVYFMKNRKTAGTAQISPAADNDKVDLEGHPTIINIEETNQNNDEK